MTAHTFLYLLHGVGNSGIRYCSKRKDKSINMKMNNHYINSACENSCIMRSPEESQGYQG